MRTLAFLILFCAPLYGEDVTTTNAVGDITTKISERRAADGRPELRVDTVYRGKTKILQILSRPDKQGKLAVVARSYLVNGKLHMVETDENGHGFFESVAIFDPATGDFELFKRNADGSVKPVPTKALKAVKESKAAADESLAKVLHEMSERE